MLFQSLVSKSAPSKHFINSIPHSSNEISALRTLLFVSSNAFVTNLLTPNSFLISRTIESESTETICNHLANAVLFFSFFNINFINFYFIFIIPLYIIHGTNDIFQFLPDYLLRSINTTTN